MNRKAACCLGLLLGSAVAGLALAQEKPAAPVKTSANVPNDHILILSEGGPLLLSLKVVLNGRPLVEHWRERALTLFRFLDADQDGNLSREEVVRLRLAVFPEIGGAGQPTDYDLDGKITAEEFLRWLRESNSGPLHISQYSTAVNPAYGVYQIDSYALGSNSRELSRRLFLALDENKDGKLDAQEMERAEAVLRSLDEDEDEVLTVSEVMNNAAVTSRLGDTRQAPGGAALSRSTQPRLLILATEANLDSAVRLLQMSYSREDVAISRRRLRREDIHLAPQLFQRFDKNADGWLDADEIRAFLQREPDTEVVLHLEEAAGPQQRPSARFAEAKAQFGWQVSGTQDDVTLGIAGTRVRISANSWLSVIAQRRSGSRDAAKADFINTSLKTAVLAFMRADTDGNGYLDDQEFRRLSLTVPLLQGSTFSRLDRDGDGKIFRQEYEVYMREALEIRFLGRELSLPVMLLEHGPELFSALDANNDDKLGLREWRRAASALRTLDRDGNGIVELTELGARYQLEIGFTDGASEVSRIFSVQPVPISPSQPPEPRTFRDAPAWFRAMDRNGDGDISRREFVGSDAEFRQLDRDGDGLISLDEARAASQSGSTQQPTQSPKKP